MEFIENEDTGFVLAHCNACNCSWSIPTEDAKIAYLEINKLRLKHEHIEKRKRR